MLERNWNWRSKKLFCHIFVIGEITIRGGLPSSPCLRLCSNWEKQKRCSQIFRKVSGVFQRNFKCSKNSAVLEPRTGQFRGLEASRPRPRTWGFEAKAKANDLRLRGQGQGLQNVSSRTPPLLISACGKWMEQNWSRYRSSSILGLHSRVTESKTKNWISELSRQVQ